MSIGLYDMDMNTYGAAPFNLELMKLSSFYKKKKEVVILTPSFFPERHRKFFVRKDYYDGNFPSELIQSNIEYGGYAFSQNKYVPFDEEIEKQPPDIFLYQNFYRLFNTRTKQNDYSVMLHAEHLRLSLDGKTVWSNFQNQIRNKNKASNLIFHDYNLNDITGAREAVRETFKAMPEVKKKLFLGTKFPIQVSKEQDLLDWMEFSTTGNFSTYVYNGVMNDEALNELVKKKENSGFFQQFEYNIGASSYATDQQIIQKLPQIFKQIIFLRSYKLKFSLKYEDNFFFDKNWERVIDFMNSFIGSYQVKPKNIYQKNIHKDCMFSFAKNLEENPRFKNRIFNKQDAREIFQFVRENNYELFKLFYECGSVKLKGGIFENESRRN